jgi:two-component system repressor protein LuxO
LAPVTRLDPVIEPASAVAAGAAHASPPVAITRQRPGVVPLWQTERDAIEAAIEFYDGNVPRAAAALEISPSTIYRKRQSWTDGSQGAGGAA